MGHFLNTAFVPVIRGLEDYKRIASELFEDLVAQNVVYAEVSLASSRIPIDEVADAVGSAKHDVCADSQLQVGILVDLCPTSNARVSIVDSIYAHPVRRFFDMGLKVTVPSDDPLIFNSDITSELELLQNVFGFTPAELLQLTKNAIDGAFLSPEKKRSVKKRLENF